ncbi:MAG: hypothetical protein WCD21_02340 [Streptomyces sp.]
MDTISHRPGQSAVSRCTAVANTATEKAGPPHMLTAQDDWTCGSTEGRHYRPLTATERALLATHLPPIAGARDLEVGCATGELATHLASTGYTVDAIDWSLVSVKFLRSDAWGCRLRLRWLTIN